MANVLIYAEQIGGTFRAAAFEAVCQGKKMADALGGQAIAVAVGSGVADAASLGNYGADKVLVIDNEKVKHFTIDAYGKALADACFLSQSSTEWLYSHPSSARQD